MAIKPANEVHFKQVLELYSEFSKGYALHYNEDDLKLLAARPNCFFNVEVDRLGTVNGFIMAFDMVVWAYVDIMYVRPDCRRLGIGEKLIESIGMPDWGSVQICVDNRLLETQGIYQNNMGFKPMCEGGYKWFYKPVKDESCHD